MRFARRALAVKRRGTIHRRLTDETRRLLVLAFTIAQGRWDEFDLHFRSAVEHAVPVETLKEVLLQSAVYCGVPAANTAFHRAEAVLSTMGRPPS